MTIPLQIAIDGPVGSGKSAISLRLSQELGVVYLYTGAMYRALAFACLADSIPLTDELRVLAKLMVCGIVLEQPDAASEYFVKVVLNGSDITAAIFSPEVDAAVPAVSAHARVRQEMVRRQQELAVGKRVVMEGRDIGIRVLPNANLKIYLTASLEKRAERRQEQYRKKGVIKTKDEVIVETKGRDEHDMQRTADPLVKLPDAWELDTTDMTQDDVVTAIKRELVKRGLV